MPTRVCISPKRVIPRVSWAERSVLTVPPQIAKDRARYTHHPALSSDFGFQGPVGPRSICLRVSAGSPARLAPSAPVRFAATGSHAAFNRVSFDEYRHNIAPGPQRGKKLVLGPIQLYEPPSLRRIRLCRAALSRAPDGWRVCFRRAPDSPAEGLPRCRAGPSRYRGQLTRDQVRSGPPCLKQSDPDHCFRVGRDRHLLWRATHRPFVDTLRS